MYRRDERRNLIDGQGPRPLALFICQRVWQNLTENCFRHMDGFLCRKIHTCFDANDDALYYVLSLIPMAYLNAHSTNAFVRTHAANVQLWYMHKCINQTHRKPAVELIIPYNPPPMSSKRTNAQQPNKQQKHLQQSTRWDKSGSLLNETDKDRRICKMNGIVEMLWAIISLRGKFYVLTFGMRNAFFFNYQHCCICKHTHTFFGILEISNIRSNRFAKQKFLLNSEWQPIGALSFHMKIN